MRISRDQFAAENHGAGGLHIDIITQPGHRSAARVSAAGLLRQLDGRQEPVGAGKGSRAKPQLGRQLRRHAAPEPQLVFGELQRELGLFDACPDRGHALRHPGRDAEPACAERLDVRLGSLGLRHHQGPDAARRRQCEPFHVREPGRRRATTCPSAPTRPRTTCSRCASRRPDRSAAGSSRTRASR